MFYKVKNVKPLPDYKLEVMFDNNVIKIYDTLPLMSVFDVFNDFKTIPNLFHQVKVDVGGYGISWNDDIDLSSNELWDNGVVKLDQK